MPPTEGQAAERAALSKRLVPLKAPSWTSATSLNVVTIVVSIAHLILFVRQPELFDNQFARVGFCATDRGWLHTLEYTFLFQLAAILVLLSLAIANPSSGFSAEAIKQVPGILFHALAHLAQVREVPVISFFTKSMAANNEHSVYDLMETRVEAVQHVVFFTLFFSAILASSMGSHVLWYSLLVTLAQLFVPWKLILLYVSTAILVGKCVASISDMGDTLQFRLTAVKSFATFAIVPQGIFLVGNKSGNTQHGTIATGFLYLSATSNISSVHSSGCNPIKQFASSTSCSKSCKNSCVSKGFVRGGGSCSGWVEARCRLQWMDTLAALRVVICGSVSTQKTSIYVACSM